MSAPIGPGDRVQCVDTSSRGEPALGGIPLLTLHAIYTVAAVVHGEQCVGGGEDALKLKELPLVDRDGCGVVFAISRFRPLRGPAFDLLNSLLQPAPERELADA